MQPWNSQLQLLPRSMPSSSLGLNPTSTQRLGMKQSTKHLYCKSTLVLCILLPGCSDQQTPSVASPSIPPHVVCETVTAKELVLKDDKGDTRGSLAIDADDVVRVQLGSSHNDGVFVLSVFPDGRAALILRDRGNRNRIGMSIQDGGRPLLSLTENANIILRDERGRNRAVLRVPTNGTPELRLYNDQLKKTSIVPD